MEEYKEAVTNCKQAVANPQGMAPGWAQRFPARREDPVIALKRILGVTQFEKTRIAFALSFLTEEVGAQRQMGGGAIPRFHSTNPRASTSLFSKERGLARKQCALGHDGTTTFDSIHLPFASAHLKSWGV
jgi:hypothetical protein